MGPRICYPLLFLVSFSWVQTLFSCPCSCLRLMSKSQMMLQSLSFHGSGCSADSVLTEISPDQQVATLVFSDFIVEKNGPAETRRKQKFCDVSLSILTSPLLSLASFDLRTDGSFDIEEGIRADKTLSYRSNAHSEATLLNSWTQHGYEAGDDVTRSNMSLLLEGGHRCEVYNQTVSLSNMLSIRPFPNISNSASGFLSLDTLELKLPVAGVNRLKDCEVSWGTAFQGPSLGAVAAAFLTSVYSFLVP